MATTGSAWMSSAQGARASSSQRARTKPMARARARALPARSPRPAAAAVTAAARRSWGPWATQAAPTSTGEGRSTGETWAASSAQATRPSSPERTGAIRLM